MYSESRPFGKIRNLCWPVYSYEHKKLIPMLILFFLISFNYSLLRSMKIALIVTAKGSGAEVLSYLKVGAILPGAIIFTLIMAKLMGRYTREKVVYITMCFFITYFIAFIFVLYPYNQQLQLDSLADYLQQNIFRAEGFQGLIAIIRHINLTVFYVIAEMWSTIVLCMLFWGFANEVTKIKEAERFYSILALGSNSSGILSGIYAQWVKDLDFHNLTSLYNHDSQWVAYQLLTVLLLSIFSVYIFYWLNKSIFHEERILDGKIKKIKLSLIECILYIKQSKYLTYVVILVISYSVIYNLADVVWTFKAKEIYYSSVKLNAYINKISSITGVLAVLFALLLSGNVIRFFGWTAAALVTPITCLITSILFFSSLCFEDYIAIFTSLISNPGNFVLLMGSLQMTLGRACKYTVFDQAKEIAFIPLPKMEQRKGKAVVEGLASRFAKSGGSLIHLILLMFLGNMLSTVPYIFLIIILCTVFWIFSVIKLGSIINKKDIPPSNQRLQPSPA